MPEETLGNLGERRIIHELLAPRYREASEGFGDDCAHLPPVEDGRSLVITTDPCPEPMAAILGYTDLYYRGWLLATLNLSDLAASGASPVGLLTSLVLPSATATRDFIRLLDGIDECAASVGAAVLGGNLKEGPRIDLHATAVGAAVAPPMSRVGCKPGDIVAVVGDLGYFWAGVLATQRNADVNPSAMDKVMANVLTPRPQIHAGVALHATGVVHASMDNSDGLGPSLAALAAANSVSLVLDFRAVAFDDDVSSIAATIGIDPIRLAMGWGDWQLVVCVDADGVGDAASAARQCNVSFTAIGRVVAGDGVWLNDHTGRRRLTAPDSERFASESWFSAGIDTYIDRLVAGSLTAD